MSFTCFNNDLAQAALMIFRFAASLRKPFIASIDGSRTKGRESSRFRASLVSANPPARLRHRVQPYEKTLNESSLRRSSEQTFANLALTNLHRTKLKWAVFSRVRRADAETKASPTRLFGCGSVLLASLRSCDAPAPKEV